MNPRSGEPRYSVGASLTQPPLAVAEDLHTGELLDFPGRAVMTLGSLMGKRPAGDDSET